MTPTKKSAASAAPAALPPAAPPKEDERAIVVAPPKGLVALSSAELDDLLSGTEDLSPEVFSIPLWCLNTKATDDEGEPIPATRWYNTHTKEARRELIGTVLMIVRSREMRVFDNADNKVRVYCRSKDMETGYTTPNMPEGVMRSHKTACSTCVMAQWNQPKGAGPHITRFWNPKTKGGSPCSEVWTLLFFDDETQQIGILRLYHTSLSSFRSFYSRAFSPKLNSEGKRFKPAIFTQRLLISSETIPNMKAARLTCESLGEHQLQDALNYKTILFKYKDAVMASLSRYEDVEEVTVTDATGDAAVEDATVTDPNMPF